MESERSFTPKPEKPTVLYHASRNKDIEKFEPRIGKRRDENEGAQIFATPSKAMAMMFLVDTDDSWTQSGTMDGVPYIIISDKERFTALDTGGTVYSLPSDTFETDSEKGLCEMEYTSEESVVPTDSESVDSALDAMIENGVKVYFVNQETFRQILESSDNGESIVNNLEPVSG